MPAVRIFSTLLFLLSLTACATNSLNDGINDYYFPAPYVDDWHAAVARDTMADTENIRVTFLHRTKESSHHIVRIRDREKPHIHKTHDLTVFVLQGEGTMTIRGQSRPCKAGDVMVIHRRTPHFFVNKGPDLAVAYAVFTPPLEAPDFELVD